MFCMMWSVGAILDLEDRAKMETFLYQHEQKIKYPPVQEGETMFEYKVGDNGIVFALVFFIYTQCHKS